MEGPALQCQAEELKPYPEGPGGWASRKRWDGVLSVQGRQLGSGGKKRDQRQGEWVAALSCLTRDSGVISTQDGDLTWWLNG